MLRNDFLVLAIYDNSDYTLISYIEKPTYVEYLPTYNEGGKFKIVAQITEQNSQCIKKGYFVHIESNVIGVIDYINLSSNNTITLGGTLGDKLLSQRYIFESSDISNTSPSDAIEEVYDDLTAIPSMTFVDYTQYSGDPINVLVEPKDFLSFVQDLCQKYEVGYRIVIETINPLTLNFELYKGQDKSDSVIMSKNFESISDFECTSSSEDQVNYVKVLGQNDIEVEVTTTPTPTGTDLCEYLLDCSGIEQGSMTEAEYRALLTEKGQEVINKHKVKTTYSGSYTGLTFRYGTDYSLGDIVSARDFHLDIDTQQRITGYVKQFDSSGIYLSLKFGEKQNTISAISHDLIKRVEAIEHKEDSTPEPSGGGVGEDIGNHSERFNDYTDNEQAARDSWLHIEGKNNKALGGSQGGNYCTSIGGEGNRSENSRWCDIHGYSNEVIYAYYSTITGDSNTINSCSWLVVSGSNNDVNACNGSMIGGQHNTVSGSDSSIVFGEYNNTDCDYGIIVGYDNDVLYSHYCIVAGHSNTVFSSSDGLVVGEGNIMTASWCGIFGKYGETDVDDRIAVTNGTGAQNLQKTFYVKDTGDVWGKAWHNTGADYAEYFEWADGNPDNEDRCGMLVAFGGIKQKTYIYDDIYNENIEIYQSDKIELANGNEILGAISAKASVIGNDDNGVWHGKYKADIYGRREKDEAGNDVLSDEYNPKQKYIPRSQRSEWAVVGLLGRIIINDNGQCQPGKPIRAIHGIAVPAQNDGIKNIIVLRRLDESHIEVLIK